MNAMNSIAKAMQRVCTMSELRNGMERTAELARLNAIQKVRTLDVLCARYTAHSGNTAGSYAELSRSAHLAAYDLMTYGEVCDGLHMLEPAVCLSLMESGRLMQERALAHEALHASNALSPASVFYDDLIDLRQLQTPLSKANLRFDLLEGDDLAIQPPQEPPVGVSAAGVDEPHIDEPH